MNGRRGDASTQIDLRLSREFSFSTVGVELLAEVFNLLNAENAARYRGARYVIDPTKPTTLPIRERLAPNPVFGTPAAYSGDPLQGEQRLIQLGVRLRY